MTYTLFDLTYRTARELDIVYEGSATGGSTSTLIDTDDRVEANDYWNDGTLWILEDAGGAGAAPEGEMDVIQDFNTTTSTLTLRDGVTTAIGAGDKYAIGKRRYRLNILKQAVNRSLQKLGPVLPIATAEVTTTELTSQYAVPTTPAGVNLYDLRRVFIQRLQYADTLQDEPWTELKNWYIHTSTAGVPATILFPYDLPADHKLKLMYCVPHPELYDATAQLSETIPVEYVVYDSAATCLNWYRQKTQINEPAMVENIAYYRQLAESFKISPLMPRDPVQVIDEENADRFLLYAQRQGAT